MKKLLFILLFSLNLFAFNKVQTNKIINAYNIGKNIKAIDGTSFGLTLPSIMGQESSWGKYNIGDKYNETGRLKSLYDSSLGNFQIKLSTAKLIIMKNNKLRKRYSYLVNKDKSTYKEYEHYKQKLEYYKNIIFSKSWNRRVKQGNRKAINTVNWAKKEFLKYHTLWKKSSKQAKQDTMLINKLMYDFKFEAEISGYYLKSLYNEAYKKFGKREAYRRAVGRYNGGWDNKRYFKKVMKRMKTVRKIIK